MLISNLNEKKIAIIGATGFIGGRLFEILKNDGIDPLVILRSFTKAANLARYNYNDILCDLNNAEKIKESLKGIDICFNCAHDFTSSQNDMLSAINNLALACIDNNVKLIHLSSVAVHEPMHSELIDESSEMCTKNNFYGFTKKLIEEKLLNFQKNLNLDVIILRPTNVYGPFSGAWTIGPCNKLINGKVVLTEESKQSINNLIYVDDVCNYMIQASKSKIDIDVKPIFLINGPDNNISWSKFYQNYSEILNVEMPIYVDEKKIIKNNKNFFKFIINGIKNISMFEDNPFTAYFVSILKKLPNSIKSKLKIYQKGLSSKLGETIFYPNNKEISDYKNKSIVSSEKARLTLNYEPKYSYEKGMEKTSQFIEWFYEKS